MQFKKGRGAMEIIVFNQEELSDALAAGYKSICLCDNDYRLSASADTSFLAIGRVTASVPVNRAECARINMRFLNFEPEYLGLATAFIPLKYSGALNSGSFISSGGSFSTSYRMSGSYTLAGSYRLSGSYSFLTSYVTSYTTSYRFASSYGYVSSFATSFASSFGTSFRPASSFKSSFARQENHGSDGVVAVFGYGINLI